jgi:hypothetical protein
VGGAAAAEPQGSTPAAFLTAFGPAAEAQPVGNVLASRGPGGTSNAASFGVSPVLPALFGSGLPGQMNSARDRVAAGPDGAGTELPLVEPPAPAAPAEAAQTDEPAPAAWDGDGAGSSPEEPDGYDRWFASLADEGGAEDWGLLAAPEPADTDAAADPEALRAALQALFDDNA